MMMKTLTSKLLAALTAVLLLSGFTAASTIPPLKHPDEMLQFTADLTYELATGFGFEPHYCGETLARTLPEEVIASWMHCFSKPGVDRHIIMALWDSEFYALLAEHHESRIFGPMESWEMTVDGRYFHRMYYNMDYWITFLVVLGEDGELIIDIHRYL